MGLHSHPQAHVWLPKAEPGSPANIPLTPPQQSWPEVPGDTGLESPGAFVWVSFRGDFGTWTQDDQFTTRASDPEQTDDVPEKACSHSLVLLGKLGTKKTDLPQGSACLLLPHSIVRSLATMPHRLPLYPPQSCHLPSTPCSRPLWFQRTSWVLFLSKASHSTLPLASPFPPFFLFSNHSVFCCVCLAALPTWPMDML